MIFSALLLREPTFYTPFSPLSSVDFPRFIFIEITWNRSQFALDGEKINNLYGFPLLLLTFYGEERKKASSTTR